MTPAVITTKSGASWQEVAKDRQRHRDETISAVEPAIPEITNVPLNTLSVAKQVLTADEIKITEATVEHLVAKLAKGELSSIKVASAFLRRAALAQKVVWSLKRTTLLQTNQSSD